MARSVGVPPRHRSNGIVSVAGCWHTRRRPAAKLTCPKSYDCLHRLSALPQIGLPPRHLSSACGHEGRQRRRLGQPCNRPCKLCARAVMRHFATRGQLEFVCPWSLVPSYALRARHRLLPVITVTAYREVPKPCYTARRLPLSPLIASEHPLLHIVKTSPASPCRLNLFLSPRNPAMGGGWRPMAKPAESGAHRRS